MRLSRSLSAVAATLVAGAVLAACSSGDADKTATTGATSAKVATVAVAQELNTIDPPQAIDTNSAIVINNVDEGLYRLDKNNQPIPAGAAALPKISADGLTYTIALNPAAKWSDGTPVTAADYVFAWQRTVGLDNASENQTYYSPILNADAIIAGKKKPDTLGVKAVDDHTLQITLHAPVSYFTSLLSSVPFFPLSQAYVTKEGDKFGSDSEHALYNGPFTLADFAGPGVGTGWTYVKNPTYWDASAVKLDKINVQVVKETSTAVNLYKSGELDEVGISGQQVQAEQADPGFVAETTSTVAFLGYNQTKAAFADQKVREAISLVIDRKALAANVLADGSTAATGLIPPGLASYQGQDFAAASGDALTTDVAQAKQLWAEAKSELGISTLTIKLQTFDSDRVKAVAEYLQGVIESNLDGTKVEISSNPVANFLKNVTGGDFDVYLVTWGADFADPSSQLGLFGSSAGANWGKYKDPAFDAALNAAQTTDANTPGARWADLLKAQKVLLDDQGVTPIYFQSSTVLRNPKLTGVVFHSAGAGLEYKTATLAQ